MQPNKKREFIRVTSNFSVDETELLGQGQYGKVYVGFKSDERKEVAVKKFTEEKLSQFGKLFQREVEILQKLKFKNHPNLVKYYGYDRKNGIVYLFFELCQGNLMSKLTNGPIKEEAVKRYFRDIMAGLVEVHSLGIIHRDLKPENILFDSEDTLKLTDFGLSRQTNVEGSLKLTMAVGTYAFRTPETFLNKQYDQRSDVWSAGLILYQMLAGKLCREYPINSEKDIDRRNLDLQRGKLNLSFDGFEPIWQRLLRKMLVYDREKRATSKEIYDQLQAWNNRTLFSQFKTEIPVQPVEKIEQKEPKQQQISSQKQEVLESEILTSLKYEEDCKSLPEYLQYLDYYYECRRISELAQRQLLRVVKESKLSAKYPNFFVLCTCFLANSMVFVRFSTIIDEMSLTHYPNILQECKQLTPSEKERYALQRNTKKIKFEQVSKVYEKNFVQSTDKLLSYRQKKEMSHFQTIFQMISQLAVSISEIKFLKVINLFDKLYNGIEFKLFMETSDSQAKILFLLKIIKEISLRFSRGFHPMAEDQKRQLINNLQSLDIDAIRSHLSK